MPQKRLAGMRTAMLSSPDARHRQTGKTAVKHPRRWNHHVLLRRSLHSLQALLTRLCAHMPSPPQSWHTRLTLLCWQMLVPPQSLQVLVIGKQLFSFFGGWCRERVVCAYACANTHAQDLSHTLTHSLTHSLTNVYACVCACARTHTRVRTHAHTARTSTEETEERA